MIARTPAKLAANQLNAPKSTGPGQDRLQRRQAQTPAFSDKT